MHACNNIMHLVTCELGFYQSSLIGVIGLDWIGLVLTLTHSIAHTATPEPGYFITFTFPSKVLNLQDAENVNIVVSEYMLSFCYFCRKIWTGLAVILLLTRLGQVVNQPHSLLRINLVLLKELGRCGHHQHGSCRRMCYPLQLI